MRVQRSRTGDGLWLTIDFTCWLASSTESAKEASVSKTPPWRSSKLKWDSWPAACNARKGNAISCAASKTVDSSARTLGPVQRSVRRGNWT